MQYDTGDPDTSGDASAPMPTIGVNLRSSDFMRDAAGAALAGELCADRWRRAEERGPGNSYRPTDVGVLVVDGTLIMGPFPIVVQTLTPGDPCRRRCARPRDDPRVTGTGERRSRISRRRPARSLPPGRRGSVRPDTRYARVIAGTAAAPPPPQYWPRSPPAPLLDERSFSDADARYGAGQAAYTAPRTGSRGGAS